MQCPKCRTTIPDNSVLCQVCGYDLRTDAVRYHLSESDPFSSMGDLDDSGHNHDSTDHLRGQSENRYQPLDELDDWSGDTADRTDNLSDWKDRRYMYCTACGNQIPADSQFCVYCGKQFFGATPPPPRPQFQWKTWMTVTACCVFLAAAILLLLPAGKSDPTPPYYEGNPGSSYVEPDDVYTPPLSDACDYILCRGTDSSGNTYELVANQKESSLGYEITVGIIKNNQWLYPMSADFPFLDEDGLFHVSVSMAGESGTSLANVNSVIDNIYFVDSGAFLIECYHETDSWVSTYDHYYILFSCTTLESCTIDCQEYTLLYRYSAPTFSGGQVESYGKIYTENGNMVLYTETSGTSSGWLEDQVFSWYILNAQTLRQDQLTSRMAGIRPESVLSEGLIFASDQCFYNTSMQKVIDLSDYTIDMWYDGSLYFQDGTCTFTASNDLGTEFLITIDKSGKVLNEITK